MKIYFADRQLRPYNDCNDAFHGERMQIVVDGRDGFRTCQKQMDNLNRSNEDICLITNVPLFLSGEYAWNEKEQLFDIFVECKSNKFVRINELTNRELRMGHNLCKMYISGEFDEAIKNN